MNKYIIETNTVTDKAKVKKYLNSKEIAYVKTDSMDGTTYFFVTHENKDFDIAGATFNVKFIESPLNPVDADHENIPMKQPECDVIENINVNIEKEKFSNGTLAGYLIALLVLVGLYVVLV
jgi:hypothetical protein